MKQKAKDKYKGRFDKVRDISRFSMVFNSIPLLLQILKELRAQGIKAIVSLGRRLKTVSMKRKRR